MGSGNEAYYFTIYMGIAKPMKLFSKHNYCMLLTCLLRFLALCSYLQRMVSHSSTDNFYMTASITSIVSILAPSSHERQPEDDYCLPEEVQRRRDESNSGTYQDLNLDTMDYTSMYSKIQDSCRQQTPTVARGGHVYAVVDSTSVEPPSQYAKLQ